MAKRSIKPDPAGTLMQLKVTLEGRPSIWRRLLVPADIKLSKLHAVLQISMGWEESHLHCFRYEHMTYESAASREMEGGVFDPDDTQDEAKVRLIDVVHREKDWMLYEYDFGDSWEHEVRVEKILPTEPGCVRRVRLPGRCPRLSARGLRRQHGYAHLLKVLANPTHPEHGETLEWLGERFDPAAFDAAQVDAVLLKLKL